jgi:hypothetical protein
MATTLQKPRKACLFASLGGSQPEIGVGLGYHVPLLDPRPAPPSRCLVPKQSSL